MHRRRIDFEDERHRVKCNDQKQQEINAAGTSSLSLSLSLGRAPSIFVSFRVYLFRQVRVCVPMLDEEFTLPQLLLPSKSRHFIKFQSLCVRIGLFELRGTTVCSVLKA
jgi:hypothetical protein